MDQALTLLDWGKVRIKIGISIDGAFDVCRRRLRRGAVRAGRYREIGTTDSTERFEQTEISRTGRAQLSNKRR